MGESENGQRVSNAVDALDETIKEIRSPIFSLHSRLAPDEVGLRARILVVVEEAAGSPGFAPEPRLAGRLDDEVPADTGEYLLLSPGYPYSVATNAPSSLLSATAPFGWASGYLATDESPRSQARSRPGPEVLGSGPQCS